MDESLEELRARLKQREKELRDDVDRQSIQAAKEKHKNALQPDSVETTSGQQGGNTD